MQTIRKNPREAERVREERNAPCPCGSGLKYKKCCLIKIENSEALRITLNRAIKKKLWDVFYHNYKGSIAQAMFFRRVKTIEIEPDHYLYRFNAIVKGDENKDLILVKFDGAKIIVEELMRNGKSYEDWKKEQSEKK